MVGGDMTAIYEVNSASGRTLFATEAQAKAHIEKIAPEVGFIVARELNGEKRPLADHENAFERINRTLGHGWTLEQLVLRSLEDASKLNLVRKMLEQCGCACAYEHHPDCHAPSCDDRCLTCRITSVVRP